MQKALCGEASSFVSSQHLTKVRADCPSIVCILAAGSKTLPILLANSNQLYFNNLVKTLCRKTSYRCPHRLNLTSQ